MKTRIALLLGLAIAITPASVAAQTDSSPTPLDIDLTLVDRLCGSVAADEVVASECAADVAAALTQMNEAVPAGEQSLLDQAVALVDDTIADLGEVDIEAALDDVLASARDFEFNVDIDVQGAIDDAVAAIEDLDLYLDVDVQAVLDDVVAQALLASEDFDLQAAVDSALAEAQTAISEADLQGTVDGAVAALETSVEEARTVIAEAQSWAQQNQVAVCRGGSVSLGTTVGVAVFVVTGVEWLGLQAFWATERFTNGVCGDIVE